MSFNRNHIADVDHDAKQLLKSLDQRVLPALTNLHEFKKSAAARPLTLTEKEQYSALFSTVATQMDNLWNHLRPELDIQLIVPQKVPPPDAPPATLVMSRLTSEEDRDPTILPSISAKEAETTVLTEEELRSLEKLQEQYRLDLYELLEKLVKGNGKNSQFAEQVKKNKEQRDRDLMNARKSMEDAKDRVRKSQMNII